MRDRASEAQHQIDRWTEPQLITSIYALLHIYAKYEKMRDRGGGWGGRGWISKEQD